MKKKVLIGGLSILAIVLGVYFLLPSAADYNEKADVLFDQQKYAEAFDYYLKAAKKEDGHASYRLGILYQNGWGVTASETKAIEYFQKAADKQDPDGEYELAYHYFCQHDYEKALTYAEKSATQNHAYAAYLLGYLYEQGKGVEADLKKALEWYEKAAPRNDNAKLNAATLYLHAKGTEQDYGKALQLFKDLAQKGMTSSYNDLGYMYEKGLGTEKDEKEACYWYRKGAEANHQVAQYNFAASLWSGRGVAQDREEALKWFRKSASQGYDHAIEFVKQYEAWERQEQARQAAERKRKSYEEPRICPGCQGTGRVLAGTGKWENCGLCGGTGVFQSFTGRWKDMIDAIDNMW